MEEVECYKGEPYVIAADIYRLEGQVGRCGWTWYTGSSGWMYRVWLEEVLGFKLQANRIKEEGDKVPFITKSNPSNTQGSLLSPCGFYWECTELTYAHFAS